MFRTTTILRPLLLLAALALAGCPVGGQDEDADETPPEGSGDPAALYTVGGAVSGLTASSLAIDLEHGGEQQEIAIQSDGAFTFPTGIPDGTDFRMFVGIAGMTDDFTQDCRDESFSGTIASANVNEIQITCRKAFHVGGTVSGLEGTGLELAIGQSPQTAVPLEITGNGSFTSLGTGFVTGDPYYVGIGTSSGIPDQPGDPDQICKVEDGSGVIADSDVSNVQVRCASASVSFTVEDLYGSGFVVSLVYQQAAGGGDVVTGQEDMEVAVDGDYTFETTLYRGDAYDVQISQQPSDPDQECQVENGSGTIEGDVSNVAVTCPKPYRYYRYDDSYTKWHAVPSNLVDPADPDAAATPLEDGEQLGDVLHDDYLFGPGPAVALGSVSGLGAEDLFAHYLEADRLDGGAPEANGVVHSNATGKTYWLAVESPQGVMPISANLDPTGTVLLASNYVTLETWWKFRKIDQATFRLEITRAELLGFDNRDHWFDYESEEQPAGSLRATVDLRIRAFKAGPGDALDDAGSETDAEEGDEVAEVFFDAHGRMDLVGRGEPKANCTGECDPPWPALWTLEPEVRADALDSLWTTNDDGIPLTGDFELETMAYVAGEDQVSLASLREPIVVEIDLSGVPIGDEFIVLSEAWVRGHNTFSPEGGAAAYLRDPASFEPEEGMEGADGGVTVQTTGLVIIDLDVDGQPELDTLRAASPPPPPACEPASGPSSELAFDADSYLQAESREGRTPVRIRRSGSTAEHLRALIDKIVLTPEKGREDLRIDLHGDLAGILVIASRKGARPGNAVSGPCMIALVAGLGFNHSRTATLRAAC